MLGSGSRKPSPGNTKCNLGDRSSLFQTAWLLQAEGGGERSGKGHRVHSTYVGSGLALLTPRPYGLCGAFLKPLPGSKFCPRKDPKASGMKWAKVSLSQAQTYRPRRRHPIFLCDLILPPTRVTRSPPNYKAVQGPSSPAPWSLPGSLTPRMQCEWRWGHESCLTCTSFLNHRSGFPSESQHFH